MASDKDKLGASENLQKKGSIRENLKTISSLIPYLWPKTQIGLKVRVSFALFLLGVAKGINVSIPYFLKESIDKLSIETTGIIFVPIGLLIG